MSSWKTITAVLCTYGFLKELRPSEPFLTEYLINEKWANITLEQAYYDVYPVWTYSYMAILIFVFLLTDFLRYKPVIVVEGFAYISTWCLLLWGQGVQLMQVMQVTYGLATATEVAYYTYIYAKVEYKHFQKVTSCTRTAFLSGRFISGVLAQLLTSTGLLDFRGLNYVSLAAVSLATVIAFVLPRVERTQYFHNRGDHFDNLKNSDEQQDYGETADGPGSVARMIVNDFTSSYKNSYVVKWSLWWALAMCGNFQVGNYIQPLWETILPVSEAAQEGREIYNGAVEASSTLAGACLSFSFGFIHLNWMLIGEPILSILSLLSGGLIITMAFTSHIWIAYVGYFLFRALYQMLITVASYEIAQNIKESSYGLIFGVNTFLALLFQTVLTMVVADDIGFSFPPRIQFLIYGLFWCSIGVIFIATFTANLLRSGLSGYMARLKSEGFWIEGEVPGNNSDKIEVPLGSTEIH